MKLKPFRAIWLDAQRPQRERWAAAIGTSYGYLQKLAGEFATPSLDFAMRMKATVPELDVAAFGLELGGRAIDVRGSTIRLQPA